MTSLSSANRGFDAATDYGSTQPICASAPAQGRSARVQMFDAVTELVHSYDSAQPTKTFTPFIISFVPATRARWDLFIASPACSAGTRLPYNAYATIRRIGQGRAPI